MAVMVREREISPVELVEAHLRQIEVQNPRLNAFVTVLAEQARREAVSREVQVMRGEALGLLHGVPLTIKDSFDIAGLPTLAGSRFRSGHRAAEDSTAVTRMRAEGAILLGKTNTPEYLTTYETDNEVTGRTNNPWNLERTPGGSSGGESAAIAAFCSAGGLGSDGGGSVRIPAHFCGITALKPTPGRVSAAGHYPAINHPGGLLGVAGPMARTATDLRLLFSALAGYDSQDPFSAPVPLRPAEWDGFRVGVMEQFYDVPVDEEIQAAVREAAALIGELGVPVDRFEPRGLERAPNVWWFFFGRVNALPLSKMIEGRAQEASRTLHEFLESARKEPAPSGEEVLTMLATRDRMRCALLRQMEQWPVLLLPPCGITAFPHGARRYAAGERTIGLFQAMMPVTWVNLLGLPAVVIPFAISAEGLPIGIQLVGRPYEEELLLEMAVRIEEARGPFTGPAL
jgi:Asp-tRNA(Asn)/Glu-tRNA(Gln) amidotransferase A subunit family amidase